MPRPTVSRNVTSATDSSVSTTESTKTGSKSTKAASKPNVGQRTIISTVTTRSKAVTIAQQNPKLRQSTLTPLMSKFRLATPLSSPEKRLERSDSETESVKERLRKSPKKSPSTVSQEQNIEPDSLVVVQRVRFAPRRNLFGKPDEPQNAASPGLSTHRITTPEVPKKFAKPLQKSIKDQQPKITESFPVRKSSRLQRDVKKEKDEEQKMIQQRILDGVEDERIEVQEIPGKGRGLVVVKPFKKNEFVVEYAGPLVSAHEAKELEMKYAKEPEKHKTGCYMYYFEHRGIKKCIDATAESGRYGRLLNHSRTRANLRTEVFEIVTKKGIVPHLILRATRDIEEGEELLYDYGDRSPASLEAFPWLKD